MNCQIEEPATAPPSTVQCYEARTARDLADATALHGHVYRTQLGLNPIREPKTICAQQRVLVAQHDAHTLATITLQSLAFEPAATSRSPLELESLYRLDGLGIEPHRIAEVRRMAVLPRHAGVWSQLTTRAVEFSLQAGITHWLGLVETGSNAPSEAPLVNAVAAAHGTCIEPFPLRTLRPTAPAESNSTQRTPFYRARHLKHLPLPPKVRAFGKLLGARAAGTAMMHPQYPRLIMPMLMNLQQYRLTSTQTKPLTAATNGALT